MTGRRIHIAQQPSMPGDPGDGWVVECGDLLFVVDTFDEAIGWARQTLDRGHPATCNP